MLALASLLLALAAPPPSAASLDVSVTPSRDPAGRPWTVQLLKKGAGNRLDFLTEGPVRADGTWHRERLQRDVPYRVRVKTGDDQGWWMDEEPFTLKAAETKRALTMGKVPVRGTVKFGNKLLRATVVFGTEGARVAVRFRSDEKGGFKGFLPREGPWRVSVASDAPRVNKIVEVRVDPPPAKDAESEVEVSLSSYTIEGKVVEQDGNPLATAGILQVRKVTPPAGDGVEKRIPGDLDPAAFRLEVFEAGEYTLVAAAEGKESRAEHVVVAANGTVEPPAVVLVLRPLNVLRGRVVASEAAVAQASVERGQLAGETGGAPLQKTTDAEGRFEMPVNAGAREVCLTLRKGGLAMRMVRVPVTAEEQVVAMSPEKGTLRIDPNATLEHAGCAMVPTIRFAAAVNLPMEPGPYKLCRAESTGGAPPCVEGELKAGATLTLTFGQKP